MGWFIDGMDLSTYAYNIVNRGAGWRTPARRGENTEVPSRDGRIWNNQKPFDEGSLGLSMWAVGANVDGTIPSDPGSRALMRDNMDALTGLFGQGGRLLQVVRSEGTNVVRNRLRNPSMEGPTRPLAVDQNLVKNPIIAGDESTTSEEQVTVNYVRNPSANTTFRMFSYANNGASHFVTSTAQAETGTQSFKIATDSATASSLGIGYYADLDPGVYNISFSAYVPSGGGQGISQSISTGRVGVRESGTGNPTTTFNTSVVGGGPFNKDTWIRCSVAVNLTEAAKYVYFYVVFGTTIDNGDALFVDNLQITPGARNWDSFNGNTAGDGWIEHRWGTEPHKSFSYKVTRVPSQWFRSDVMRIGWDSSDFASAPYSLRAFCTAEDDPDGSVTGGYVYTPVDVRPGQVVSASAKVKWELGTARPLAIRFHYKDADGADIGSPVTGSTATPSSSNFSTTLLLENQTVPANCVSINVAVVCPSTITVFDAFQVDDVLVREGTTAGTFFYGGTASTPGNTYGWEDEPHNSVSLKYVAAPEAWSPSLTQTTITKDTAWFEAGTSSMLVQCTSGQDCEVYSDGGDITRGNAPGSHTAPPGGKITALGTVIARHAGRVRMGVREYDNAGNTIGWVSGSLQDVDLADDQEQAFRVDNATFSTNARSWRLIFRMFQTGGITAPNWSGDAFQVDAALATTAGGTIAPAGVVYFDGDSADSYWLGEPHLTASEKGGTARRCFAECVQSIDMTSMAGGTRAEFSVDLVLPDPFWEEVVPKTRVCTVISTDQRFDLLEWDGATGPMNDFLYTIRGPIRNPKLIDYISGQWMRYEGYVAAGQDLIVDTEAWTAMNNGVDAIRGIFHGGGYPLFGLTTEGAFRWPPRLRVTCDSRGSGASVTVRGRRKFLAA